MQKCEYFVFSTLTKLVLQEKRENVLCPFGIISFGHCYRAIGNGVLEIHVILVIIIIRRYEWDIKPFGFFAAECSLCLQSTSVFSCCCSKSEKLIVSKFKSLKMFKSFC
jgi:hypothetical protein